MALVEYAEKELTRAGLLSSDSPYDGMIGHAVEELMHVFAAQGHSGQSAEMTITIFTQLARFRPLSPLGNPTKTGEYNDVTYGEKHPVWQSTRKSSVFSEDGGRTWYDIDLKPRWWERLFLHRKGRRVA